MFAYSKWLSTNVSTRYVIAEKLGIKKTQVTHVSNNEIVNDGFSISDVENALTVENLSKALEIESTDKSVEELFNMLIDVIEGRAEIKKEDVVVTEEVIEENKPEVLTSNEPQNETKESSKIKAGNTRGTKKK